MKKAVALAAVSAVFALALFGCAQESNDTAQESNEPTQEATAEDSRSAQYEVAYEG